MRIGKIGEIALIDRLTKGLRSDRTVVKGPGDDAAVIRWTRDRYMLFASDILVEGVHFKRGSAAPYQIGWKALGRNLSDIAAMGGIPRYAVVSAALPGSLDSGFAAGMMRGIRSLAEKFGVNIVGGDVAACPKIVIDVAVVGEVEKPKAVFRSGARPGDLIFVTGAIGGSSKGRHLRFTPRVKEAREIVKRFAVSSMIDVSDGLELDVWRVLRASSAGGAIYKEAVPLSGDAPAFDRAIREGEDFELVFTMSGPEARKFIKSGPGIAGTKVAMIGQIMPERFGYRLILPDGRQRKLGAGGYKHFS